MSDWLELELAEELRPVAAPDELWGRIVAVRTTPVHRRESPRHSWSLLPIAAIVTLMIAAATLWLVAKGQDPGLDLQQLAIQQLRDPRPLDLQSADPAQIKAWANRQAGVELSFPAGTPVCFLGARMIRKSGTRIAAVTYRVGGDTATLLVARAGSSADLGHGHQWKSQGQTYALASSNPAHLDGACVLCHASL